VLLVPCAARAVPRHRDPPSGGRPGTPAAAGTAGQPARRPARWSGRRGRRPHRAALCGVPPASWGTAGAPERRQARNPRGPVDRPGPDVIPARSGDLHHANAPARYGRPRLDTASAQRCRRDASGQSRGMTIIARNWQPRDCAAFCHAGITRMSDGGPSRLVYLPSSTCQSTESAHLFGSWGIRDPCPGGTEAGRGRCCAGWFPGPEGRAAARLSGSARDSMASAGTSAGQARCGVRRASALRTTASTASSLSSRSRARPAR
jgi:hypothetical protein